MIILEDVGCSPSKESKMFFLVFKAFEEQRGLEMGKNIKCLRTNMEENSIAKSLIHFVIKKAYNDRKLLLILHNKIT